MSNSGWNNGICSNIDGSRDNHIQWNKPGWERQMLFDITYMWNMKESVAIETLYRMEIDPQT